MQFRTTLAGLLTLVALLAIFLAAFVMSTPSSARLCWTITTSLIIGHLIAALVIRGERRAYSIGFVTVTSTCLAMYYLDLQEHLFSPDDVVSAIHSQIRTTTRYGGVGNLPLEEHPRYAVIKEMIDAGTTVQNPPYEWTSPQMQFFFYVGRAFFTLVLGMIGGEFALWLGRPSANHAQKDDA